MCPSVLRLCEIIICYYHQFRFKSSSNMLTLEERINIKELVSGLNLDDLLSLASTITKGLLKPNNREDANEAILQHSDSVESILGRKKVSKELIFNYLHWKKVATDPNLDKKSLVNMLANYWKAQIQADCSSQTVSKQTVNLISQDNCVQDVALTTDLGPGEVDLLALKFTEWFFQLLNKDFLEGGNFALGPENFWMDASLHMQLHSNGVVTTEEVGSSAEVVRVIEGTKQRHKLYFSPNLSAQGVRGRSEPHGMVSVLVCGTLHQSAGVVVGIFEQIFYLIKDPLTNNAWKVKRTQLNLTSKDNVMALPTLSDGELTRPLLPIQNPD